MSDVGTDPKDDSTETYVEGRVALTGMLGTIVFLVGGMLLTKVLHDALDVFDWLLASGGYWGPFFLLGHAAVAVPLFAVRTTNGWHCTVFLVASVPFAIVYAAIGIAAGLVQINLPWGPPLTVALAVFIALSAPVMLLHMHLFDRPPAPETGTTTAMQKWGPHSAIELAVLTFPGLFLLTAFIDLVNATGAASSLHKVNWYIITIFALWSCMTFAGKWHRMGRRAIAAMISGTIVGTALLTVCSMLLLGMVLPDAGPPVANIVVPFLLYLLHFIGTAKWLGRDPGRQS